MAQYFVKAFWTVDAEFQINLYCTTQTSHFHSTLHQWMKIDTDKLGAV